MVRIWKQAVLASIKWTHIEGLFYTAGSTTLRNLTQEGHIILTYVVVVVLFSCSVVSDSLWSQGLQHARPPCLSPTLGVYSNSCALNWWCHPTISSSVNLFSSCLQSFPASGSFQMSQLFASGSQSIGCFCISPSNEHTGLISFKMDWLDLLAVQGTLKSLLQHHSSKASILWHSTLFYSPSLTSIHDYWKKEALTRWTLLAK